MRAIIRLTCARSCLAEDHVSLVVPWSDCNDKDKGQSLRSSRGQRRGGEMCTKGSRLGEGTDYSEALRKFCVLDCLGQQSSVLVTAWMRQ